MNSCNNSNQRVPCTNSQQRDREMGSRTRKEGEPWEHRMKTEREAFEHLPLGMTYVPMQRWGELYPLEEGFHCGTIFKELNLPFTGRRGC